MAKFGVSRHTHDALNRRIGTSSGGATSWFGYDGDHVQAVHSTGTTVTERFLHGPGVDAVYGQEKNGTPRWLLTDGRGSVTGVTNASGSSTGQKNYNTFGGTQSESGVTDTLFAYTGREWDDAAGLQYSRNRWYDPSSKRWLSEDPIGFAGGDANLSRYVGNSPGTFTDPNGLIAMGPDGGRRSSESVDEFDGDYGRGDNNRIDEEFPYEETSSGGGDFPHDDDPEPQPPKEPSPGQRHVYSMTGKNSSWEKYLIASDKYLREHREWRLRNGKFTPEEIEVLNTEGFLTPGGEVVVSLAGFVAGPVGTGANVADAINSAKKGDWVGFGLAAASAIPAAGYLFAFINGYRKVAKSAALVRKMKLLKEIETAKAAHAARLAEEAAAKVNQRGGQYGHLPDHPSVNSGKPFTQAQRRKILEANKAKNDGVYRDDRTGEIGQKGQQHKKGVTPPDNEVHVDHAYPKSEGGPNSFANAEVRLRKHNLKKGKKIE